MYRWTLLHHWWAWLQVIQNTLWRCSEKRVGTFNQRTETDEWLLFILSFFITRPASFPPLNQRVEAERERERESSVSAGVVLLFNVVCSQKKKHKGMYLFGHVATNACENIKPTTLRFVKCRNTSCYFFLKWCRILQFNDVVMAATFPMFCPHNNRSSQCNTIHDTTHPGWNVCWRVFSSVSGGFLFGGTKTKCREMNKNTMSAMESSDDSQMF